MEVSKLLIADSSDEFSSALEEALRGSYELRSCRTGHEALELIGTFRPDVMVVDLMLPGLDGISLLQRDEVQELKPVILATSRFVSDYVLESMDRLGVGYLMLKPCDVHATVERITDLTLRAKHPAVSGPDPKVVISDILLTLGISTKLRGYGYLREAVVIMGQRPGLSITKELYPAVGHRCGAASIHVERSIRSAINAAWGRRDEQTWRKYFGRGPDQALIRPTNAEFISRMVDNLRRDGCVFSE